MMKTLLAIALVLAQISDGDRHFALRAEGSRNGRAAATQIDAAIAAYQRAVAANRDDIQAHSKLLAAYRFKGAYVASTNDQKKAIYGEAKKAGEQAVAAVESALVARGLKNPSKA